MKKKSYYSWSIYIIITLRKTSQHTTVFSTSASQIGHPGEQCAPLRQARLPRAMYILHCSAVSNGIYRFEPDSPDPNPSSYSQPALFTVWLLSPRLNVTPVCKWRALRIIGRGAARGSMFPHGEAFSSGSPMRARCRMTVAEPSTAIFYAV